jgi:hypothetical protein
MQRGTGIAAAGFVILLLALAVLPCAALYVRVRQGKSRCFIEMLREHEVVIVRYRSPDQAPLPPEPEVCLCPLENAGEAALCARPRLTRSRGTLVLR